MKEIEMYLLHGKYTNQTLYSIEEDGRVWSWMTNKYLKPGTGSNGRPFVVLWDGQKGHTRYIHQLVAETFLGPRPANKVVSHRDGNIHDNHYTNLVYETQKENLARRKQHGTMDTGFNNSRAVLQPGDPERIKELKASGLTQQEIADIFGVSRVTISRVLSGKRYGGDLG